MKLALALLLLPAIAFGAEGDGKAITTRELLMAVVFLLLWISIKLGSIADLLDKKEIEVDEHTGDVRTKTSWRGTGEVIAFFSAIVSIYFVQKFFW